MGKIKHGKTGTLAFKSWISMRTRVTDPRHDSYKHYGGKGIKICSSWLGVNGFINFFNDMGVRPEGTTLDRFDNDKDYEPSNCRWATNAQQARNKCTNVIIEYDGLKMCISDWAIKYGVKVKTMCERYSRGHRPPQLFEKSLRYMSGRENKLRGL